MKKKYIHYSIQFGSVCLLLCFFSTSNLLAHNLVKTSKAYTSDTELEFSAISNNEKTGLIGLWPDINIPSFFTLKINKEFNIATRKKDVIGVFPLTDTGEVLKVGVGRENITPDPQVKNWVTGKPYEGIEDSLYVHALSLFDGYNEVVMVNWDLTDAGESATEEVRKAISAQLNIPPGNILVNGSHNHSAPWSPVYSAGYRGKELDTWWAIRYMPSQNDDPYFKKWMKGLIDQTVRAAQKAHKSLQPATLWIGRVDASKYMNNRRPRNPKWGIADANVPKGYNFKNEKYNPDVIVGGASFGPMDRTMALLSFRDIDGNNIVSIFHTAIHGVAIYPYSNSISGDWPEEASRQISKAIGGKAIFFQGAAGDINPWRRGREAVKEMGKGLAMLAKEAYEYSAELTPGKLNVVHSKVWLPLSALGQERTGLDSVASEIQVISYGSLAFVTLPGEPLTELGTEIRENSPFPQTLVFGYSNGNGVHYASLPKEKKYGGYEVEIGTSGTENAGKILVVQAVQLLEKAKNNQDHSRVK